MKVIQFFYNGACHINQAIDRWLTAPEPNAAGNMGIYRILYSLFYLWHLSSQFAVYLSGFSAVASSIPDVKKVYDVKWFGRWVESFGPPSPAFYQALEFVLVAALILLLFGYKTRWVTLVVIAVGCFIEAGYISFNFEHASVLLVFFIPFFMVLGNGWGSTYSLDAVLQKRRGRASVSPSSSHWRYTLATHSILVIVSFLFLTSAYFKMFEGGTWLVNRDLVANFVLRRNVQAAIDGLPLNHLAPWIAQTPLVFESLRIGTLVFEGFFFLALFNRNLRDSFLAIALIFHSVNAIWMIVSFTPVLVVYGLFVDWQSAKAFLWDNRLSHKINPWPKVASKWLIFGLLFGAVAVGLLWNSSLNIRGLFNSGGLINFRTIWFPVLPIALCWLVLSLSRASRFWLKQIPYGSYR